MGHFSPKLRSSRKALVRLAERKAFESYIRRGVVPEALAALSAAAIDEGEFSALGARLTAKALSSGKATSHYTWRTAGDDKVRDAHAALHGQVFAWASPPPGGHPGTEHNCRCWAEPYFGDPSGPDSLQQLVRDRRVPADPSSDIASIETLTRPDGSIAASTTDKVDGTRIHSIFQGASVSRLVSFPDGADYQSLRFGANQDIAVLEGGETRLRVAQLRLFAPGAAPPLVVPPSPQPSDAEYDYDTTLLLISPYAVLLRAAVELFNTIAAAPEPMGGGAGDLSVVAFKIWTGGTEGDVVSLQQETLTQEQVSQVCQALPDVQTWTNEAASELLPERSLLSAKDWGNAVHWAIYKRITDLKRISPTVLANVFPEISIDEDRRDSDDEDGPSYGQSGTSRLDVLEKVSVTTYCVYDVKTGTSGLTQKRLLELLDKLPKGVLVYIMEVRPFE